MSRIKIDALTSVHIGSGETLQYATDFVGVTVGDDDFISIVEPRKVLELIGEEHIPNWLSAIERKDSVKKIISQFAPKAKPEDYSKRLIVNWANVKSTDTLKEHIHDGMGKPYIPGSSIKGAIRTAVLATLANKRSGLDAKVKDFKGKINANTIESELLGKDPNSDIFRFLQVGDAIFGDNYEVAIRMVNINERPKKGFWDESKQQLIEAISPEDSAEFQMKLNPEYYTFAKANWPRLQKTSSIGELPTEMKSMAPLFQLINQHTKSLIESEIEYWQDKKDEDESESVTTYIEKMSAILNVVKSCKNGKECVLRLGHGSGWRFITGAWTENFDNFYSVVVPASRPKNTYYQDFDFPKSRRVDDQCELLGFVKLTEL